MCDEQNNVCCLEKTLKKIVDLQCQDLPCDNISGCDKPFLGPTPTLISYNTRPISLYNCITGDLWEFTYTDSEGTTATSTVFRVEAVDDCCCTCRILIDNGDGTYSATSEFVTISLRCVGAIRCYADVYIEGVN